MIHIKVTIEEYLQIKALLNMVKGELSAGRLILTHVLVDVKKRVLIATDGHILRQVKIDDNSGLIPCDVKDDFQLEFKDFMLTKTQLKLQTNGKGELGITIKQTDTDYPDYERVLPKQNEGGDSFPNALAFNLKTLERFTKTLMGIGLDGTTIVLEPTSQLGAIRVYDVPKYIKDRIFLGVLMPCRISK